MIVVVDIHSNWHAKDADRLAALGLPATTIAGGGSTKWLPDFTAQLVAAGITDVLVIPDNEPRRVHKPFPARSALAASGLAMGARVELECIAYVPPRRTR